MPTKEEVKKQVAELNVRIKTDLDLINSELDKESPEWDVVHGNLSDVHEAKEQIGDAVMDYLNVKEEEDESKEEKSDTEEKPNVMPLCDRCRKSPALENSNLCKDCLNIPSWTQEFGMP